MVEEPSTPRAELLIAAAGPVMSFALAGMAFGGRAVAGGPVSVLVLFGYVGAANLVIAVFNLLPGYPLDGGRLVRARDRKSTRLNSSHSQISYAVFCLKKKSSEVKGRRPFKSCRPQ